MVGTITSLEYVKDFTLRMLAQSNAEIIHVDIRKFKIKLQENENLSCVGIYSLLEDEIIDLAGIFVEDNRLTLLCYWK